MMATSEISKEKKQAIITLIQSIQKMSRTLKVSLGAVPKTIKCCDETGSNEDRHRKGRPKVTSAAEDKFISYQPQSSSNRQISTSTVQWRL
jgi:transposase